MKATITYDVVIIGGGVVGTALACALRDSSLSVALIDATLPGARGLQTAEDLAHASENLRSTSASDRLNTLIAPEAPQPDPRVFALSPTSQRLLQQCGVWEQLDQTRLQAITAMRIASTKGATLNFTAYEAQVEYLAIMVENRALQHALDSAAQGHYTRYSHTQPKALAYAGQRIRIPLDQGDTLETTLVVGADGSRSWTRAQLQRLQRCYQPPTAYAQQAVVMTFAIEKPHHGIAWQWFCEDGSILAWLPLPGNFISMVWSAPDALADRYFKGSAEAGAAQIAARGHHTLGRLQPVNAPHSYPLYALQLKQTVAPRIALIGDAAHLIHPLAGQGVNLGLQDAFRLGYLLLHAASADVGEVRWLHRFENERYYDRLVWHTLTRGLQRLFSPPTPGPLGHLTALCRERGLRTLENMHGLKMWLAQAAAARD